MLQSFQVEYQKWEEGRNKELLRNNDLKNEEDLKIEKRERRENKAR